MNASLFTLNYIISHLFRLVLNLVSELLEMSRNVIINKANILKPGRCNKLKVLYETSLTWNYRLK